MGSTIISDSLMWGVLALQICIVLGILALVFRHEAVSRFIERHVLTFPFLLAVGAVLGSFYYSDILGFEPCRLCIYQRWITIALVVVTGLASYRRDRGAFPYIAGLSLMGLLIGLYHALLPILRSSYICAPGEVSCTVNYVTGFGYITIPIMSVTVFAAMLLVWAFQRVPKAVV